MAKHTIVASVVVPVIAVLASACSSSSHSYCPEGGALCFSGPTKDVAISSLDGWTECFRNTYATSTATVADILATCNGANLMLACRATGSDTLQLAAHAPRADVIHDTGGEDKPHVANGTGWYFHSDPSASFAWGFAPAGDEIQLDSCDVMASSDTPGADGDRRLCWHTHQGLLDGGWRCGADEELNSSAAFERIIYQAP